ncbi:hypothetical protein BDV33DRAFT_136098 [Aspergillus novoparasiticus]|uniref:Uncharacterized protein n=1 Tax=Aspergillus novoparasiticus TaxID=986946 RepID=A0A5N6F4Y4_9EURO|nr:hypothetical protein BDV33DRAFT_136098 [Aspergillus novoparasiticus]
MLAYSDLPSTSLIEHSPGNSPGNVSNQTYLDIFSRRKNVLGCPILLKFLFLSRISLTDVICDLWQVFWLAYTFFYILMEIKWWSFDCLAGIA